MSKFELSVRSNYVSSWGVQEALRELFQNAYDQEVEHSESVAYQGYDEETQVLWIGNKNTVLTRDTLLFGTSSKEANSKQIGQFGEGYKLAMLVLTRENRKVTIFNQGLQEQWSPRLKVAKRMNNAEILVVDMNYYKPKDLSSKDLLIKIEGITAKDLEELTERNLRLRDYKHSEGNDSGEVLLDEEEQGKIYVNGLYVTQVDNYHYGYNFSPSALELNRDRNMARGFDIAWAAGKVLKTLDSKTIAQAIKDKAPEAEYLSLNNYETKEKEVQAEIVKSYKKAFGEEIKVVTSDTEAVAWQNKGCAGVVVAPDVVVEAFQEAEGDWREEVTETLPWVERLKLWRIKFEPNISYAALEELDELIEEYQE